jgi:hypothetical protein
LTTVASIAVLRQLLRRLDRRVNHRAVRDNRHLAAVPQNLGLADFQQMRLALDVCADAVAARVAHRGRAYVLQHRVEHVAHLALVLRGHRDHVRHAAQVRDVQEAVVRRPVAADDPRPVHAELDVQILQAHVVDYLVEGALQERRVDGADGLQAFRRHPGGEGDAVLLGDAHVEGALGELFENLVNARAVGHRGRERDDLLVLRHQLAHRLPEDRRVLREGFDDLTGAPVFRSKGPVACHA